MIHIILLSGGSGSRLWPLSNDARSKQFLKVLKDEDKNKQSMVQRTFQKLDNVEIEKNIVIATCLSQKNSIEQQLNNYKYDVVFEPERRDTAPAIMLACAYLAWEKNVSQDDTVIVMPIDTYAAQQYYDGITSLDKAVQSEVADLILEGAFPTYPSEKFGYIVPDQSDSEYPKEVIEFIEKPNTLQAELLIKKGALWNCGVFAFKLRFILDILKTFTHIDSYRLLYDFYHQLPKNSFDYEVVEKASSIAVIEYKGEWKDLGTWNTLTDEMIEPISGKVFNDEKCINTHAINETELPMIVAGVTNAIIVATPDGILVSNKESSAHIKSLVTKASTNRPMYETRQWGEYRVINRELQNEKDYSLEKLLIIDAGKQLSYQKHFNRSEVWTVTSGRGEVVLDGETQLVTRGSVVSIQPNVKHSVRAFETLHIIEIQLGTNLVEDDIERYGFYWKP